MRGLVVLRWLTRKLGKRRAVSYARVHPNDEPIVKAIYIGVEMMGASTVRQVAEATAGGPLSKEGWAHFGPRWERAWSAVVAPTGRADYAKP